MVQQQEPPTMTLSEILSDLVSLRVCDPAAALALVSARPSMSQSQSESQTHADDNDDADLKRAKELVKLHYDVKEAHKRGQLSRGLEEARDMVSRAVGG